MRLPRMGSAMINKAGPALPVEGFETTLEKNKQKKKKTWWCGVLCGMGDAADLYVQLCTREGKPGLPPFLDQS